MPAYFLITPALMAIIAIMYIPEIAKAASNVDNRNHQISNGKHAVSDKIL